MGRRNTEASSQITWTDREAKIAGKKIGRKRRADRKLRHPKNLWQKGAKT